MTDDPFDRAVSRTPDPRARRGAKARAGFRIHAWVYVAVNALLALIWWASPSGEGAEGVVYTALFWGVGLAAHFWAVRRAFVPKTGLRREGPGSG